MHVINFILFCPHFCAHKYKRKKSFAKNVCYKLSANDADAWLLCNFNYDGKTKTFFVYMQDRRKTDENIYYVLCILAIKAVILNLFSVWTLLDDSLKVVDTFNNKIN